MAKPHFSIFSFFTALLLLLLPSSIVAQSKGNIPVGTTMRATAHSSSWVSPSNEFAFGFHQYLNRTNLFLLSIWYAKIPDTIVWYANEGNPVPQGSTVKLTANEGLILSDPKGSHLWNTSSNLSGSQVVSHGYMNDTGNFILKSSSDNNPLWQSFDYPTDTLLPTQLMNIDGKVVSRLSDTNFTRGRFRMHLQTDGNLVFDVIDLITYLPNSQPYFATNTWKPPNQGKQVIYNGSGHMYLVAPNGTSLYDLIPGDKILSTRDYYQRATLNFSGVLTWFSHPRDSNEGSWSKTYSLAGNICSVGCGYNSICTYDDEAYQFACNCPSHYSLMDPNDNYGSCKPDFELSEDGQYNLVQLPNTKFDNCEERFQDISEEQCKSSCLNDQFCAIATWDTNNNCCKTKPLFSGGHNGKNIATTAWLKVGSDSNSEMPNIPPAPFAKGKTKLITVYKVLLGGSFFVIFTLLSLIIFFMYIKKGLIRIEPRKEYGNVHCFSYKFLQEATDDFKEELGRGAFGVVYKGTIRVEGSPVIVAVKKLDRISNDADKEFTNEVNVIGMTHHKNLVRLVGFCKDKDQRLLVYEYMSGGSLADYLFSDQKTQGWVVRTQMAQGIARGLLYLHQECNTQIIHCDIKPQNILLDNCQNARISDFGLAKLLVLDQSYTNTAIRGTKGYVAPEWFKNKPVTTKVDVYSFGVLLLEIICCRKNASMEIFEEQRPILTDWAFDCYRFNKLNDLVNDDTEAQHDQQKFNKFVMVALWCIQDDPSIRPNMLTVTQMLEGFAEVPVPPCPTSFLSTTQE